MKGLQSVAFLSAVLEKGTQHSTWSNEKTGAQWTPWHPHSWTGASCIGFFPQCEKGGACACLSFPQPQTPFPEVTANLAPIMESLQRLSLTQTKPLSSGHDSSKRINHLVLIGLTTIFSLYFMINNCQVTLSTQVNLSLLLHDLCTFMEFQ